MALTLTIVSVRHHIVLVRLRSRIGRSLMSRCGPNSGIVATEIVIMLIFHSFLVSKRLFDVSEGVRSVGRSLMHLLVCLELNVVTDRRRRVLFEMLLLLL